MTPNPTPATLIAEINTLISQLTDMANTPLDTNPETFEKFSKQLSAKMAEMGALPPAQLKNHQEELIGMMASVDVLQQTLQKGRSLTQQELKNILLRQKQQKSYNQR